MHEFRKLKIWQKAIDISVLVYKMTKNFPDSKKFGMTSQMRRAGVSMSSNIAEGCGRDSKKELEYFISVAYGSSCELISLNVTSFKLDYIDEIVMTNLEKEINEWQKMTFNFKKHIHAKT